MTKLITLLLFVCCLISTSYQQEITHQPITYSPPNFGNDNAAGSQIWALQNAQGQERKVKPCPRRLNRDNAEEQWIPSFTSRITHPMHESLVLQPQALKNDEFIPPMPEAKTENDLQSSPDRRSLVSVYVKSSKSKDEGCDDHDHDGASETPLITVNAEETALQYIKDCLKKKQNAIANAYKQTALGSSRRAMSESDDSDFSNYNRDVDPSDSNLLENESNNDNYPSVLDADNSRDGGLQNNLEDRYAKTLTTKLMDPEKGTGIAERRAFDNIPSNARICYACSTATNPSCWEPDKRTTVKYCTKEQSCVSKTFGVKSSLTMIRDCANTCEDSAVPGIEPKYTKCNLCHSDYCNGAFSINSFNVLIILGISVVKCTLSVYQNV